MSGFEGGHGGIREPPEAVLAGESVPVENDANDLYDGLVEELVGLLKTRPGYADRSNAELQDRAREIIHRRTN